MRKLTTWAMMACALGAAALASAEMTAIKAATLHVGDGTRIENAVVLIDGDMITAVGPGVPVPDGVEVIEVEGAHLTPGLIDANTIIETEDLFEAPRPRVAGGDLAPLLGKLGPWVDREAGEEAARRGIERFGATQACACAACSGFAACPLAASHADFVVDEETVGCPCCGFPASGLFHSLVSGVTRDAFRVESTSEVVPHTRVIDGVSLRSPDFDRLVRSGVTTVFLAPDSSAVIGPTGAIVRTAGPMSKRVIDSSASVQAALGSDPYGLGLPNMMPSGGFVTTRTRRPTTRMGVMWVFRKAMYDSARLEAGLEVTGADQASDAALRVLAGVRSGETPLRIHARDANDIEAALQLADEFDLSFTLVEAAEAHLVAEQLRERDVPVVLGPVAPGRLGMRGMSRDKMRMKLVTAKTLFDAGVEPALSAQDMRDEDALSRQAMLAMREGLTLDQAVRATTLNPARVLGISDQTGTIEAGKRADLVLWTGEPFASTSRPALVIVNGRVAFSEKD